MVVEAQGYCIIFWDPRTNKEAMSSSVMQKHEEHIGNELDDMKPYVYLWEN